MEASIPSVSSLLTIDGQGWCQVLDAGSSAALPRRIVSPNYDSRPPGFAVSLLVIHCISLPPGEFAGDAVIRLFSNTLDPEAHPSFAPVHHLKVSAHFFLRRDGALIQFVSCNDRAWHAGESNWQGRARCNDFSIGIELEGCEDTPFTPAQYERLTALVGALRTRYPLTAAAGHSDIAPGRKTDPGPYFDWSRIAAAGLPHLPA